LLKIVETRFGSERLGPLFSLQPEMSCLLAKYRCIVLPESLEGEWWKEKMNSLPICPNAYQNIVRSRLRELSPAESGTCSVIHCNDVVDVAFVFSAEVLEHMWTDLAGMTKVFFTRILNHIPFSLTITKSYPSCIWFSLLSVKELVRKMMSCK
jgi:hypothetical protein